MKSKEANHQNPRGCQRTTLSSSSATGGRTLPFFSPIAVGTTEICGTLVGLETASLGDFTESTADLSRSSISFGSVAVHTHNVTLGDNPAVKKGLPLALGSFQKSETFNVDEYEVMSQGRPKRANRIPEHLREEWLRENGHSKESLLKIAQEIDVIRAERSISKLDLNRMEEYQVMSNVSYRQNKRHADSAAAASKTNKDEAQKSPSKTKSNSLFSRLSQTRTRTTKNPTGPI